VIRDRFRNRPYWPTEVNFTFDNGISRAVPLRI